MSISNIQCSRQHWISVSSSERCLLTPSNKRHLSAPGVAHIRDLVSVCDPQLPTQVPTFHVPQTPDNKVYIYQCCTCTHMVENTIEIIHCAADLLVNQFSPFIFFSFQFRKQESNQICISNLVHMIH